VLRPVVTQIFAREAAEHNAIWTEETGGTNLAYPVVTHTH
jgi:hypothetical protein